MQVAIITEGLQGTGYGHLTRCLSIYQAFEEKNITPLYIANCDVNGKEYLPKIDLINFDWISKTKILLNKIRNFDIAIVDSYLAPLEIYEKIKNNVKKAVYIDDYLRLEYPPGVVINGTIGSEYLPYKKDGQHQYLLGLKYMPLRKEFWDVEKPKKDKSEVIDILITLGGQDIRQLTFSILNSLLVEHPNLNYYVVLGKKHKFNNYENNVKFYYSQSANEMLSLMLKCDISITAAGQTTYELARTGTNTIAIGVIENQIYNIKGWIDNGFIKEEIWYNDKTYLERINREIQRMMKNKKSRIFYDGQGARRIINKIASINE